MSDQLKQYIRERRAQFEEDFNDDKVWNNIEKRTIKERDCRHVRQTDMYWKVAALVLLLICSALLVDKYLIEEQDEKLTGDYKETLNEFKEVEGFYMSLIHEKRQIIRDKLEDQHQIKEDFANELNELDSAYTQLKNQLDEGNTENVVDALTLNLQIRIEILNKQLMILEELKAKEYESII